MEYKTGDIIFFRIKFKWYNPTTWISALVRLFATIEYNHVGIVVLNWDMPMVNEAVGRGVISTPLNADWHKELIKIE